MEHIDRTKRFIICSASAGAGKTFTLVKQYLELAFSTKNGWGVDTALSPEATDQKLQNQFKKILAITFTNKAANEMKDRVLKYLDEIIDKGDKSAMAQSIHSDLNLPYPTLQHYAVIVSEAILHNYSDLAICTIDSFTHRVVRTFAHDLGLPQNFEVMMDTNDIIENAVDELMGLVGMQGEDDLTQMLADFAESLMEDKGKYNIESAITNLAKELFDEDAPEHLKKLNQLNLKDFIDIRKQLSLTNRTFEEDLKKSATNALKGIADNGFDQDDFYYGNKSIFAYFKKIADRNYDSPNKYVIDFVENGKTCSGKCTKRNELETYKPTIINHFNDIQQQLNTGLKLYNSRKLLLANLYTLAILNKLNAIINTYSKDNELLHISEFNKRISNIVQDEPAPFIYERLGNRYHNYLIDEFQDTSKLQWLNLVPLLENGISEEGYSMIVGDGKQAIYRFRKGDVEQFNALPHIDSEHHGRLIENPHTYYRGRLKENYRSASTIVDFNNRFFEWALRNRFSGNQILQDTYIGKHSNPDLEQKSVKGVGYVQIDFCNDNDDREVLWGKLHQCIRDLVYSKDYRYQDIAILARNNKTLSDVSNFLTRKEIPIVSSESFLLSNSNVALIVCATLRYLTDNSDRVAILTVLELLQRLGIVKTSFEQDFLTKTPIDLGERLAREGLNLQCDLLLSMGLYDCCEEIIRMLQLQEIETAYTATFLNCVANYAKNHRQDIREFLEWFDEQKGKISTNTASDRDAVRLLTIHKAKGLEAPIVLYPILNERSKRNNMWVNIDNKDALRIPIGLVAFGGKEPTLFDAQFQEEALRCEMDNVNVLYVALTRPKEKLFVFCEPRSSSGTTDYISLLQDFAQGNMEPHPQEDTLFYTLGENTPRKSSSNGDTTPNNTIVSLERASYPNWAPRIAIATQQSALLNAYQQERIQHGIRMHEILSKIRTADDIPQAVASFAQRNGLSQEESDSLVGDIQQITDKYPQFFAPGLKVLNEQNLMFQGKSHRPDRIVFAEGETWVIDYKTGAPLIDYVQQVSDYCQALTAMHYPNVKGYLLYIGNSPQLEAV